MWGGGGSRYKLPGPDYIAYVFVFLSSITICRLYKLTVSDQTQVTLQLKVGLSDLVSILLAGPPLLRGEGGEKIFSPGPEPALSGPGSYVRF
jgi:hypothetical protein